MSEHDKVFQRFYRTDASRSTEGSGLGLSLVKAVVELHRMSIELVSRESGLCVKLGYGEQVVPNTTGRSVAALN